MKAEGDSFFNKIIYIVNAIMKVLYQYVARNIKSIVFICYLRDY